MNARETQGAPRSSVCASSGGVSRAGFYRFGDLTRGRVPTGLDQIWVENVYNRGRLHSALHSTVTGIDGVTEAEDAERQEFGAERLLALLAAAKRRKRPNRSRS